MLPGLKNPDGGSINQDLPHVDSRSQTGTTRLYNVKADRPRCVDVMSWHSRERGIRTGLLLIRIAGVAVSMELRSGIS
jgi:hypothetical protein